MVRARVLVWLAGAIALAGCKKHIDMESIDAGAAAPDPAAATPTTAAATQDSPKDDTSAAAATGSTGGDTLEALTDAKKTPTPVASKPKGDAGSTASGKTGAKPPSSGGTATTAPPATTPPAASPPECATAARFCHHPSVASDAAIRRLCDSNKAACESKGGHI